MKLLAAAFLSFFSVAQLATAHPTGHEAEATQTIQHMLTSGDHLLIIGSIVAILGVFVVQQLRTRKN